MGKDERFDCRPDTEFAAFAEPERIISIRINDLPDHRKGDPQL